MRMWTQADDERLRQRLGVDRWTARAVGDELGRSRNAVIGRAKRLGVALNSEHKYGRGARRRVETKQAMGASPANGAPQRGVTAARHSSHGEAGAPGMAGSAGQASEATAPPTEAEQTAPTPLRWSLADPRMVIGRCCRWAVDEGDERGRHLFCAAPVPKAGDVYCDHHAKAAWTTRAAVRAASEASKAALERARRESKLKSARRFNDALFI